MNDINAILDEVLTREGWPEYTVHPNDRGGPTKGGITLRTLEAWRHRRCTRAELQRLSRDEALLILRRRYVDANGIASLPDGRLKHQVIDSAVLSGPLLSAKDLQRTLQTVTVDGLIGPVTLAAVAACESETLGHRLAITRALRLARHVQAHPDQLVFLTGWLTRALHFAVPLNDPA